MTDGRASEAGLLAAFDRSFAIIDFQPDGTIIAANPVALAVLSLAAEEVVGRNHSGLIHAAEAGDPAYADFWAGLAAGTPNSGRFCLIGASDKRVWLQGAYCPVLDDDGALVSVALTAVDITIPMMQEEDLRGQMRALHRTLGVVEYMPGGMILGVNENFCAALGYDESELICEEDRLFVPDAVMSDDEYAAFWDSVAAGDTFLGEVRRRSKSGTEVHFFLSYNPIFDGNGSLEKIVAFTFDITPRKTALEAISAAVQKICDGNLAADIDMEFVATLEGLRLNFNRMAARLRGLVRSIAEQANGVLADSRGMAGTAADLLARSEAQAGTLELTAATMNDISRRVNATAANAAKGRSMADDVNRRAQDGRGSVTEVTNAMTLIEQVFTKIDKFTRLIESIARQTKFLGLNAAVEAARAGEAGRGFAVVAAEVRVLANKTAETAAEITDLVAESARRVETAAEMVHVNGGTMREIMVSVEEMRDRIAEIARDCGDQALSVNQITDQLAKLGAITQQNTAVADQSAGTSAGLKDKSTRLMQLIGSFDGYDGTAQATGAFAEDHDDDDFARQDRADEDAA